MIKKWAILFSIKVVFLSCPYLMASGFKNFDLSARAATLAGAFTARADDASAVFYNPAGMAFLEGIRFKTNIFFYNLTVTAFVPATGQEFRSSPFQLRGSFYLTWRLLKRLSFGIGGYSPYNTATKWPWAWPGNTICLKDARNFYTIRPAVAFSITKTLSVGVGVDFVYSNLKLNHNCILTYEGAGGTYTQFLANRYSLKGNGTGFVASLLWKINKNLQIGARYQSRVTVDSTGNNWILYSESFSVDQSNLGGYEMAQMQPPWIPFNMHLDSTSSMTTPFEAVVGMMASPFDGIRLHLDVERIGWSKTGDLVLQTDVKSDDFIPIPDYRLNLQWKDTWNVRFGLEYRMSTVFALRAGYSYQESAAEASIISPVNPELDRNVITVGLGYEGPLFSIWDGRKISELSFDIFFQYVLSKQQASSLPGYAFVYDSDHFIIGIGIGLNIL